MQAVNAFRPMKVIEESSLDINVVDRDKIDLKKKEGLAHYKEMVKNRKTKKFLQKQNKQKLKELSDKASLMFQNIKDIQKIMNDKFIGLDKSVQGAELKFKDEIEGAIKRSKVVKRNLLQNIRKKYVGGPKLA